jgi:RecB family exonuclease
MPETLKPQSPIENRKSKIETPFTFSQSSLQDYVDCARRFQLRYIDQLQWPAVETEPALENERRQAEGQQFHRLAQQHLLGLPADKLARLANSENLSRWWANWLDFRSRQDFGSFSTELSLSAPLGPHRLVAKYDLIAVQDGRATIFDWKTYHKRPKNEAMAARLQTRVYQALLVTSGAHLNGGQPFTPEQVEMVYWYTEFPQEPARFGYTPAQHQRAWDGLVKLAGEISARQDFPLTDDEKKCAYCTYRSYCDRGTRAGDEVESELSDFDINLEQVQEIEI